MRKLIRLAIAAGAVMATLAFTGSAWSAYQPRLIAVTGYRETEPGIEVRYSANGDFVRVELVEGDDAVAPRARRRVPELVALPALVRTL